MGSDGKMPAFTRGINSLTIARVIRVAFGVLAGLMLVAATADILLSGHLTIVSPASFGALLALAFLINILLVGRERNDLLTRQAAESKAAAARLKAPLEMPPVLDSMPGLPPMVIAETPPAPATPPNLGNGLKILLAEDNPVNALLIRELLRRRGHKAREVTTGTAAVAAMQEENLDLLLTDIHMPGMGGIEAARAIRAWEAANNRRRTPVVALAADALETGKRACQKAGMDGFLIKPVDPKCS